MPRTKDKCRLKDCSLALFHTAFTIHRLCSISNIIDQQLGITLMNLSTWPTGHKVPLNLTGSDLDTEAHTGLDQVPATDHQCIDDVELAVGHPPEDAMPRPWQMSQQRGELSSVFGCSFYTRSRVWHQARASTYGYWCK